MSWHHWADELRQTPQQAVTDLLRGAADIGSFERVSAHEFLLAVLPRNSRSVSRTLLGEPRSALAEPDASTDLPAHLDIGLAAWLRAQREVPRPPARKFGAYAAQVCEALQWPLYFALPQTRAALQAERALWLQWLGSLTLSAYRDPEYDYWQVLAAQQADDGLHFSGNPLWWRRGAPAPRVTSIWGCWPWPGSPSRKTTACTTCGCKHKPSSTATNTARAGARRPRKNWRKRCEVSWCAAPA